jgi:hypothetical protein
MTQTNGHQPEKIDILIDQVGRLTESIHELKALAGQQLQVAEQQNENIKQLAHQHDQTVSRLVGIVESLLPQQKNG